MTKTFQRLSYKTVVKVVIEHGPMSDNSHIAELLLSHPQVELEADDSGEEILVEIDEEDAEKSDSQDTYDNLDDSDMEYVDFDAPESPPVPTPPHLRRAEHSREMERIKRKAKAMAVKPPKRKKKKTVSEMTPMECPHCGLYLTGKWNLEAHVKRVHLKLKENACNICAKPFYTRTHLDSHVLSVHTRMCSKCNEYVTESKPWAEGMHMRDIRRVQCNCGEIISIFSSQGRSKVVPVTEILESVDDQHVSKFGCPSCQHVFGTRKECVRHMRQHANSRSARCCYVCGERFDSLKLMGQHLRLSHGIVMHKCHICDKVYNTDSSLKVHLIKAHGEQMIKMKQEGQKFVEETSEVENSEGFAVGATEYIMDVGEDDEAMKDVEEFVLTEEDGKITIMTKDHNMSIEKAQAYVEKAIKEGLVNAPEGDEGIEVIMSHI